MNNCEFIKVNSPAMQKEVARLADVIWHEHYFDILEKQQIDYMVTKFQSYEAIKQQMEEDKYEYYLIKTENIYAGYVGLQKQLENKKVFVSKLYIQKEYRGCGYGRKAFEFVENYCKSCCAEKIFLTVNKNNTNSIEVYKKLGFKMVRSQVADIGNGFVMDDFVMEK